MANRVLIVSSPTVEDTERHQMTTAIQQLLTLWTRTNENKPGKMYQDSGCNRCVAGKEVHATWQRYLAKLGLTAVRIEKVEEFIFGNENTELSDCAFQYPVFVDGKFVGAIDIARIAVGCPALYSKRMMKQWKHNLDFANQITTVGAFDLTIPFEDSVPVIDIFSVPEQLDLSKIPPCFKGRTNMAYLTEGTDPSKDE